MRKEKDIKFEWNYSKCIDAANYFCPSGVFAKFFNNNKNPAAPAPVKSRPAQLGLNYFNKYYEHLTDVGTAFEIQVYSNCTGITSLSFLFRPVRNKKEKN